MFRNLVLITVLGLFGLTATAQTTEFTYQGSLNNGGTPATGNYDFEFLLYDALTGGTLQGSMLTRSSVAVTNGTFAVKLDFGSQFPGANRFLEIHVRQTGGGGFTPLTPRQLVNSTPYSVKSLSADNATNATNAVNATTATNATTAATATNATQLNGQAASFYQNAANLNSGTIPDLRLSSNVALLTGAQTFTSAKTFALAPNFFAASGSPFFVSSNVKVANLNADLFDNLDSNAFSLAGHTHTATDITTGTLADARLSGNVDLLNFAQTFVGLKTFSNTTVFNGSVGIGTASPERNLHVFAGSAGTVTADVSAPLVVEGSGNTFINILSPDGAEKGILFGGPVSQFDGSIRYNNSGNLGGLQFRTSGNATRMVVTSTGDVGIGTTNTTQFNAKLTVISDVGGTGLTGSSDSSRGVFGVSNTGDGVVGGANFSGSGVRGVSSSGIGVRGVSNTGDGVRGESSSNIGVFGLSGSGVGVRAESFNNNIVEGYGNGVRKFHIDNNGAYTAGSDFAEALPASGNRADYGPGDVLVVSTKTPGKVEKTSRPYDTRVAGIYSTRPGMLGAEKDGTSRVDADDVPVAIVGIVPTKVSAINGTIRVGDLLTTSGIPGYAMRCSNRVKCVGAVVGKALEPFAAGKGVIKVLVMLR